MADDSKAAFPRLPVVRDDGEVLEWSQTGMTLREYAAIKAMHGMMASPVWADAARDSIADEAVAQADALLAALKESAP